VVLTIGVLSADKENVAHDLAACVFDKLNENPAVSEYEKQTSSELAEEELAGQ
jgi:hypothetical protein